MQRLCNAAKDVIVGKAQDSSTLINPLIDAGSQKKVLAFIEEAEKTTCLAFRGETPEKGFFVPPVIFKDVSPDSRVWKEELFAPVLACCNAKNLDHAIELANNSQYALTGGLFSRSPKNIDKVRRLFKVGNLYINRGCTGAIVCRQPFGGARMSGIGSKAGGPDYLIQFLEPVTVSENTVRQGFAPETAE